MEEDGKKVETYKKKNEIEETSFYKGTFYNKFEYFYKIVVERNVFYSNKFFSSTHLMKKFYLYKRL